MKSASRHSLSPSQLFSRSRALCAESGIPLGTPSSPNAKPEKTKRSPRTNIRIRAPHDQLIPAPAGNTSTPSASTTTRPVHPRACGEHSTSATSSARSSGSSPRLRGTPNRRRRHRRWRRFIPAPAGNTPHRRGCFPAAPVHPRACGEHERTKAFRRRKVGSSPRLRGTHGLWQEPHTRRRFIPAPAGNTRDAGRQGRVRAVHPRACGEHWRLPVAGHSAIGSSPRLRGTPVTQAAKGEFERFIPAPAGNTGGCRSRATARSVHPRACGEHSPRRRQMSGIAGSSPRLRGTHAAGPNGDDGARFIPAPAGNTQAAAKDKSYYPVHPRACGEHTTLATCPFCASGSSPRLRGTPRRRYSAARRASSVHPRACGEHCSRGARRGGPGGSSPRLRGTHHFRGPGRHPRRFIPAPAGNTSTDRGSDRRAAVHPRACGEHSFSSWSRSIACGSSPRLRGTLRPR